MRKLTQEEFIRRCIENHNCNYDYSLVEYTNVCNKIKIICKEHGIFEQRAFEHSKGSICPKCFMEKTINRNKILTKDTNFFIEKSSKIHNNKYDYSLSNYVKNAIPVKIICKAHGIFEQTPASHIYMKTGCPICKKLTKNEIIIRFNNKHNNKYDYSLFDYDIKKHNTKSNINIICANHGIFNQRINHHMNGTGCPFCRESRGEKTIIRILNKLSINYIRQKKFDGCININSLLFDFYIPDYNLCIEFDGSQHQKPIKIFGGKNAFNKIKLRDKIKNLYCIENNINLLRFTSKNNERYIESKISAYLK